MRFIKIAKADAWSAWLQLLQLVYNPRVQKADTNTDSNNAENDLIDVDIFDDTEQNIFDETIYTAFKCFNLMIKHVHSCTSLDVDSKEKIISKYYDLKKL